MNCYHCGDTMILKKIHDYGGYSWGWKCTHCGAIIDQIVKENHENTKIRRIKSTILTIRQKEFYRQGGIQSDERSI